MTNLKDKCPLERIVAYYYRRDEIKMKQEAGEAFPRFFALLREGAPPAIGSYEDFVHAAAEEMKSMIMAQSSSR